MRLPGGRQAQPGVATGQSALALRLGYAEVFQKARARISRAENTARRRCLGHSPLKFRCGLRDPKRPKRFHASFPTGWDVGRRFASNLLPWFPAAAQPHSLGSAL